MLRNQKIVGLVALDSKEASFGIANGERLELSKISLRVFRGSREREAQAKEDTKRTRHGSHIFFHRVAEHAAKAFLEDHQVMALIVGGPGTTKHDFLNGDYLHYELKNAVLGTVDTQSAGKEGLKEVLCKSAETIKNMCAPEEKIIVQRLLAEMTKQDTLAIYGLDPVLNALEKGEVEVALVTDNTDTIEVVALCKKCELSRSMIVNVKKKAQAVQEMTLHRAKDAAQLNMRWRKRT